jgi:hypothetical protein
MLSSAEILATLCRMSGFISFLMSALTVLL